MAELDLSSGRDGRIQDFTGAAGRASEQVNPAAMRLEAQTEGLQGLEDTFNDLTAKKKAGAAEQARRERDAAQGDGAIAASELEEEMLRKDIAEIEKQGGIINEFERQTHNNLKAELRRQELTQKIAAKYKHMGRPDLIPQVLSGLKSAGTDTASATVAKTRTQRAEMAKSRVLEQQKADDKLIRKYTSLPETSLDPVGRAELVTTLRAREAEHAANLQTLEELRTDSSLTDEARKRVADKLVADGITHNALATLQVLGPEIEAAGSGNPEAREKALINITVAEDRTRVYLAQQVGVDNVDKYMKILSPNYEMMRNRANGKVSQEAHDAYFAGIKHVAATKFANKHMDVLTTSAIYQTIAESFGPGGVPPALAAMFAPGTAKSIESAQAFLGQFNKAYRPGDTINETFDAVELISGTPKEQEEQAKTIKKALVVLADTKDPKAIQGSLNVLRKEAKRWERFPETIPVGVYSEMADVYARPDFVEVYGEVNLDQTFRGDAAAGMNAYWEKMSKDANTLMAEFIVQKPNPNPRSGDTRQVARAHPTVNPLTGEVKFTTDATEPAALAQLKKLNALVAPRMTKAVKALTHLQISKDYAATAKVLASGQRVDVIGGVPEEETKAPAKVSPASGNSSPNAPIRVTFDEDGNPVFGDE